MDMILGIFTALLIVIVIYIFREPLGSYKEEFKNSVNMKFRKK
jgi:hypothetical protein